MLAMLSIKQRISGGYIVATSVLVGMEGFAAYSMIQASATLDDYQASAAMTQFVNDLLEDVIEANVQL